MAALHILEGDGQNYRVVVHHATPTGNNANGTSLKNCVLAAGLNTTVMSEGAGLGQITPAEKSQIVAGDILEMVFTIQIPTTGTGANKLAYVQAAVASKRTDYLAQLAERLNYFGYTNG